MDGAGPAGRRAALRARLTSRPFWIRVGIVAGATVAAFGLVIWLGVLGVYDLRYARQVVPSLLTAFTVTAELIAVVISLGLSVGFLVGWARTTRFVVVRGFAAAYVDFFRSMPPIVLITFASLIGVSVLSGPNSNPYVTFGIARWLGVVALGLHTAAYQAEIVRAGILSVPVGQVEAAEAVGIPRGRILAWVILPQAFRVSLPALGNEFSSVIKDTSLLNVIGWAELSGIALVNVSVGLGVYFYAPLVVWIETGFLYFVATFVVTGSVRLLEEAFKVPGLGGARA